MVVDGQNLNFATPIGQINKSVTESEAGQRQRGNRCLFLTTGIIGQMTTRNFRLKILEETKNSSIRDTIYV